MTSIDCIIDAANKRAKEEPDFMHEFAKKAKVLEINPRSPLIEGLLRRVERLPGEDEEGDSEAEAELKEVASILIDGALVRSGFEVPDSDGYVKPLSKVYISKPDCNSQLFYSR